MKQWFRVRIPADTIKGWHRSPRATVLPTPRPGEAFFEVTDADIELFGNLQSQASNDGRDDGVLYNGGTLVLPTDNRFFVDITVDLAHRVGGDEHKGEVDADGVDTAVISFSRLLPDESVDTAFNATRQGELLGRVLRLAFTSGVATKNYRTRTSGIIEISSDTRFRMKAPFAITSVVDGDIEDP